MTCPEAIGVRETIEKHILKLYHPTTNLLLPYTEWPGYYTTSFGQKIPAIWLYGERMVPTDYVPTGIECLIGDVPLSLVTPLTGSALSIEKWSVMFVNRGTAAGTSMSTTLRDIQRRWNQTFPEDQPSYSSRKEDTYETLMCSLKISLSLSLTP